MQHLDVDEVVAAALEPPPGIDAFEYARTGLADEVQARLKAAGLEGLTLPILDGIAKLQKQSAATGAEPLGAEVWVEPTMVSSRIMSRSMSRLPSRSISRRERSRSMIVAVPAAPPASRSPTARCRRRGAASCSPPACGAPPRF